MNVKLGLIHFSAYCIFKLVTQISFLCVVATAVATAEVVVVVDVYSVHVQ